MAGARRHGRPPRTADARGGGRQAARAALHRLRSVHAPAAEPVSNGAPPLRHILPAVDHTAPAVLEIGLLLLLAALAGLAARGVGLPALVGYRRAGGRVSPVTTGDGYNVKR